MLVDEIALKKQRVSIYYFQIFARINLNLTKIIHGKLTANLGHSVLILQLF